MVRLWTSGMGAKAAYIDVVDVVVGIKAPPRGRPNRQGR
jgi:hypothetical protein